MVLGEILCVFGTEGNLIKNDANCLYLGNVFFCQFVNDFKATRVFEEFYEEQ